MARSDDSVGELQYWNTLARLRFSRLSLREKALTVFFIAALLGLWLTFQMDRHSLSLNSMRFANAEAERQSDRIAVESEIFSQYQAIIDSVDLDRLPSVEAVNAQIDNLIRQYGFTNFKTGAPKSEFGQPLTFHSFTIDLNKADYNKLIDFTNEVKSNLPYVSLRQIKIQAERRTPRFLTVKLEMESIEYTP
ncbi:MAG: hypothetical protein CBD18_04975 [Opitutales bacterium TMED158]|nr:MAG: hypothetical protein CBD18_04975 [Opitutales bacterium TMED158]